MAEVCLDSNAPMSPAHPALPHLDWLALLPGREAALATIEPMNPIIGDRPRLGPDPETT